MTTKMDDKAESYLGRKFIITREFAAPRELVFKAWTDPKHVAQWWGPRGFTNPVCQWNAVAGQPIYVVMRAPNGVDYPMGGEFREIAPPERLVMACGALNEKGEMLFEFVHAVTFAERGGKTLVTVNSHVTKVTEEAGKYLGGFEQGMTMSLERLGDLLLETTESVVDVSSERKVVISRVFDAPRELVWEVWTNPKHVVNWWGPRGFTTKIETMNVKPGGIWKQVMRGPDGTEYPSESIFTEAVKPERIVYTIGGGKKDGPEVQFVATWTFDVVEENKTRVTIHQFYPSAEMRDRTVRVYGAVEGGKQCLARLGEILAKAPLLLERTFDAPVELVWKALTNAEDIRAWSFEVSDFKPEVGFAFHFVAGKEGAKPYNHLCKVVEAVPNRKLAYTWRYEGYPGDSLVTIELSSDDGKTHVKLTHTGLESFEPEKNGDFARGNFLQGWTALIGTFLKEYVEKK